MECKATSLHLIWLVAACFAALLNTAYTFEIDEDNNAALENLKDSKTGLTKGIPFSFMCPRMPRLRHANILCGGKMCLIQCHKGYERNDDIAFVYICDFVSGRWSTLPKKKPLPWSDCRKRRRQGDSRLSKIILPVRQRVKTSSNSEKGELQESPFGNESKGQYLWSDQDNMTLE